MARKRKGTNTGIPGLSFSWKRATGVTNAKRKFAQATGVPTTKAGRQRKAAQAMGCSTFILVSIVVFVVLLFAG